MSPEIPSGERVGWVKSAESAMSAEVDATHGTPGECADFRARNLLQAFGKLDHPSVGDVSPGLYGYLKVAAEIRDRSHRSSLEDANTLRLTFDVGKEDHISLVLLGSLDEEAGLLRALGISHCRSTGSVTMVESLLLLVDNAGLSQDSATFIAGFVNTRDSRPALSLLGSLDGFVPSTPTADEFMTFVSDLRSLVSADRLAT